jgi:serine/threonine-protein kinase RsbW
MVRQITRTFDVGDELSEVGRLQQELGCIWAECGLPPDHQATALLALEELLSNTLRHGERTAATFEAQVVFRLSTEQFEIEVSDSARAFNPLNRAEPDLNVSLDKRRPGGLGIFLVRQLADQLTYQHTSGRNYVRFVRNLRGSQPS